MYFADWLRDQLEENKMRATDLARDAKIDDGIISKALSGKRIPSPNSLSKIAKVLELPVEVVFTAAGYSVTTKKPKTLKIDQLNMVVEKLPESEIEEVTEYARHRLRLIQKRGGNDVREGT